MKIIASYQFVILPSLEFYTVIIHKTENLHFNPLNFAILTRGSKFICRDK
jgi:hypothetical protein